MIFSPIIKKPRRCFVLLLVLSFFLCPDNVYSQDAWQVKGLVVKENNQPLFLATVTLLKDSLEVKKTVTDSLGNFSFELNSTDSYRIAISFAGYNTYESASLLYGNRDLGMIELKTNSKDLQGVVVQSTQNLVELSGSTITYNVAKSIDAQGTTAFDALRKTPGVFISSDNSISLNGKSGVLILLDGKQTYLSGQELTDLLKSMPASAIKAIDIMSDPTAKYDASGSAGILNIKTIKTQVKGFSGSISSGLSYGITLKQNSDLSFNYRRGKYNLFGGYNHFVGHQQYEYGSNRIQDTRGYQSITDDTDKRNRLGARLGLDYVIDKKNTVGILLNSNYVLGGGLTQTTTGISLPNSSLKEQVLYAENDYYFQKTKRYNVSANYKYENAKGTVLNLDADYGEFNKGNRNLQSNLYNYIQNGTWEENLYRSLNTIAIRLKAFKVDYATPLWKGAFEGGGKFSSIRSGNDARFLHVLASGDSLDNRRSNDFTFTEEIVSAYIGYKKTFGKWTIQTSVRSETNASAGLLAFHTNGVDSLKQSPRNETHLFPSVSLSVKPADKHSFSISYAKRIERPAYQDLNPFVYLLDELSFWQGNPFLLPQLTHRGSVQYIYKNTTILGLAFSYIDQFSTRITDTIESNKIVMIPRNLGIQKNISLTLTHNQTLRKWWELTLNSTLYRLHNELGEEASSTFPLRQLAARANLQQRFKLPHGMAAEVTGSFTSRRLTGAREFSRSISQIDVALQKNILKGKGTLRVAATDLYKGSRFRSIQSFNGFYLQSYGYYEARQIRINFTYKFADNSVKAPRSRTSALENENGRIR